MSLKTSFAPLLVLVFVVGMADAECDSAKASKDMQAAAMDMAGAGDCDKMVAAYKKMKAAFTDNACEDMMKEGQAKTQMDTLESTLDQAGCDTSGAQRAVAALSVSILAVSFFLGGVIH